MEEFDLNFDNNIGTSISKLKNNMENRHSETEIDYDKILDKLNASDTNDKLNNQSNQSNKLNNHSLDKSHINMNHFAKKLENKLDNIKKNRDLDMFADVKRLPPKMEIDSIKLVGGDKTSASQKPSKKIVVEPPKVEDKFQHKDIIIYIVLFIILNSKLIIEVIYDKISLTRENPYLNLIIRAVFFGGLLFLIKKLNLNS